MSTDNWKFIVAAYAAAWIAVVGYWIFVHGAVREARARYELAVSKAARAEGRTK